jgi:putative ABC transport system substrate-binding protein
MPDAPRVRFRGDGRRLARNSMLGRTNRRAFIAGLRSAAASPLVAQAQQSRQVRRVGVVMAGAENDPEQVKQVSAFREGMRKLGWLESRNVILEFCWQAGGAERAQAVISELINLPVDVILVGTIQAFWRFDALQATFLSCS